MRTPTCDFCNSTLIKYWYPCAPFDVNAIAFSSKGIDGPVQLLDSDSDDMTRWAACYTCSQYVDRRDYFFLAQRITRQNNTPELFGAILNLFYEFDRQRNGERQQI